MNDEKRYKAARRRIKKLKDFYSHVLVYVAFNLMLFFIDMFDGNGTLDWFFWPLLGWGSAVLIHAFDVYILDGVWGVQWEERKMQEFLGEKAKRKHKHGERLTSYDEYGDYETEDDTVALDDLVARHAEEVNGRKRPNRQ